MAGAGPRPAKRYQVVLLGGAAVGETALATRFACGRLPEQRAPSVEELCGKVIVVDAAPALPEIVDTVGAEPLVTLKGFCIKNSAGVLVRHGVRGAASFEALRPLRERVGRLRRPEAVRLVLLGTEADLDAERQVLTARGRALAREWRCPFLEQTDGGPGVHSGGERDGGPGPARGGGPAEPTNAQDTWPSERLIGE